MRIKEPKHREGKEGCKGNEGKRKEGSVSAGEFNGKDKKENAEKDTK